MIKKSVLVILTLGTFFLFIFQLILLQLFNSEYSQLSENNAVEKRPVYPNRGLIYDRNGILLVANQPVYDLMVIPENIESFDTLELINGLSISKNELLNQLKKDKFLDFLAIESTTMPDNNYEMKITFAGDSIIKIISEVK